MNCADQTCLLRTLNSLRPLPRTASEPVRIEMMRSSERMMLIRYLLEYEVPNPTLLLAETN